MFALALSARFGQRERRGAVFLLGTVPRHEIVCVEPRHGRRLSADGTAGVLAHLTPAAPNISALSEGTIVKSG
jgi:hypothetical protein